MRSLWRRTACNSSRAVVEFRPGAGDFAGSARVSRRAAAWSHTSDGLDPASRAADLRAELIAAEREYIYRLLQDGLITDEARRRIEMRARLGGGEHRVQEGRRVGVIPALAA